MQELKEYKQGGQSPRADLRPTHKVVNYLSPGEVSLGKSPRGHYSGLPTGAFNCSSSQLEPPQKSEGPGYRNKAKIFL